MRIRRVGVALGLVLALGCSLGARAAPYKVLYHLQGDSDGEEPEGGMVRDAAGNLYGSTAFGGDTQCNPDSGCGTVFKIAPDGTKTTLHVFNTGHYPWGDLAIDKSGILYGTTQGGGAYSAGTVFKIAPDGTETDLYSFTGGADGKRPYAGVIVDKKGNLYGTTYQGGGAECNGFGCGTVFKLTSHGVLAVLHAFDDTNGSRPLSGLLRDKDGNLFGTTLTGGASNGGTVFKISRDGTYSVLHSFTWGKDGGEPVGGLIADQVGNLYGTSSAGSDFDDGTVFKLGQDGSLTILWVFQDGRAPEDRLVLDKSGNLYGTTHFGGSDCDCGTIFKLTPDGAETILHTFSDGPDGEVPVGTPLLKGTKLYGVTRDGGSGTCFVGCGTVYRLRN